MVPIAAVQYGAGLVWLVVALTIYLVIAVPAALAAISRSQRTIALSAATASSTPIAPDADDEALLPGGMRPRDLYIENLA